MRPWSNTAVRYPRAKPPTTVRSRSSNFGDTKSGGGQVDLWSDFVSRCGSRQAALRKISYPEDGFFVAARRSVAKEPTLTGAKAREQEEVAQLGQRIVARFCERLVGGESLAATKKPSSG